MKRGLLLSAAASAVIFAGGDITPVQPAVDNADFWGQIGFFYQAEDWDGWNNNAGANVSRDWGDERNNNFAVTAVLGVEKEIGSGFGLGLELAGWSGLGWNIGDLMLFKGDGVLAGLTDNGGEISQAYLTYSTGNTAIKIGRQALPKAVSPWAYSGRTGGVIDISYDGIVIANTALQDTTVVAAWVDQAYTAPDMPQADEPAGSVYAGRQYDLSNLETSDDAGLFMLALINKSMANTTLSLAAYYIPDSMLNGVAGNAALGATRTAYSDTWSVWASAVGAADTVSWGLQFAYVDGDDTRTINAATGATVANTGWDATFGVAAKIGAKWGDFDTELVAGYINDGDYSLRTAGSGRGTPSAFWTFNGDFGGDVMGDESWAVILKAGYKLGNGKIFGNYGYWDVDSGSNTETANDVRVGYKFNIASVDASIEYRYLDQELRNPATDDIERHRLRVEAYYKF